MFGIRPSRENGEGMRGQGCIPFDRKIRLGCPKHNGKRFISLPQKCHISYGLNPKKGRICVAWVWGREGTEKLVNGKQHSVWFVPTGMNGLPRNVVLNFRLEFPKKWPYQLPSIRNFRNFLSNGKPPSTHFSDPILTTMAEDTKSGNRGYQTTRNDPQRG